MIIFPPGTPNSIRAGTNDTLLNMSEILPPPDHTVSGISLAQSQSWTRAAESPGLCRGSLSVKVRGRNA